LTIFHLGRKQWELKRTVLLCRKKCGVEQSVPTTCEQTVANAAPRIPHPRTKMKRGASTRFTPTVNSMPDIAFLGYPEARIKLFRARNRCENTFPARITSMNSFA
jgi:hypothetical protein